MPALISPVNLTCVIGEKCRWVFPPIFQVIPIRPCFAVLAQSLGAELGLRQALQRDGASRGKARARDAASLLCSHQEREKWPLDACYYFFFLNNCDLIKLTRNAACSHLPDGNVRKQLMLQVSPHPQTWLWCSHQLAAAFLTQCLVLLQPQPLRC